MVAESGFRRAVIAGQDELVGIRQSSSGSSVAGNAATVVLSEIAGAAGLLQGSPIFAP